MLPLGGQVALSHLRVYVPAPKAFTDLSITSGFDTQIPRLGNGGLG